MTEYKGFLIAPGWKRRSRLAEPTSTTCRGRTRLTSGTRTVPRRKGPYWLRFEGDRPPRDGVWTSWEPFRHVPSVRAEVPVP